jgi:hypothetical protein
MTFLSFVLKRIISFLIVTVHLTVALDESQMEKTVKAIKSSLTRKAAKKVGKGKATSKSSCGSYFKEKNPTFLIGCEGLTMSNPTQSYCTIFRQDGTSSPSVYGVVFLSLTTFIASSYGPFSLQKMMDTCRLLQPYGSSVNL